jgi:microsomal dipeptidase-like Zn-dependent dipeptidase
VVVVVVAVVGAAPVGATPAGADEDGTPDRYELAGGCWTMREAGTGGFVGRSGTRFATANGAADAEPFHLQATDLGHYLLYGRAGDHVAAGAAGSVVAAPDPSPAADWLVEASDGPGTFTLRLRTGESLAVGPDGTLVATAASPGSFVFEPTTGCAEYPEVELNVAGAPHVNPDPGGEVVGYVDAHLHLTAYEFLGGRAHCGRPWHRYGVEHALVDCPDHAPTGGAGAVLENVLAGDPLATHDTAGWPTFRDWPAPSSLTHEQTYHRWVERAWRGGLRVLVNLFVENRVLCEVYPLKQNSCDEMASVRLQAQRIHELERYIDAQSGGPGEGWFRIVDDPAEARRVANEGKLAVVLGIEISELFGCSSYLGQPRCTTADIDRQLDEVHALGVRQLVLIHKFDNAFGGVALDGGERGTVINAGNFYGTGRFWDLETCDPDDTGVHDNDQLASPLYTGILQAFAPALALPLYPPPHHCNRLGLSPLGAHAVDGMLDRGLLLDVDHMSVRARQAALDLVEARSYPGVLSSHSWSTPDAYPRIYALGGFTAPYAGGSTSFVEQWRERRAAAGVADGEPFALGFGADSNGLGAQGGPRGAGAANPVTYPFEALGGVVVDRQVSGERVYDVNVDGVAHYGLYVDWIEDLRRQAGDAIVADLARGAEAYLRMWAAAESAASAPAPAPTPPVAAPPVEPEPLARTGGAASLLPFTVALVAVAARRFLQLIGSPARAAQLQER